MNDGNASTAGDGLPPLRDVISRHALRANKGLGQNFILDLNLTGKIARLAGPLEGRLAIEVGPGPGGLTRALLKEGAGHVLAIERDERLRPALDEIASAFAGKLTVRYGDALAADWPALLHDMAEAQQEQRGSGASFDAKPVICSNLPYGVATKLLVDWLSGEDWPPFYDKMVLMFQREVGERIVARPNTKAYGRLAVLTQWRCDVHVALTLPAQAFTPPPKVSSAVVVFSPRPAPLGPCNIKTLGKVTAAAFGQRRKMLRVSLKQLTHMPDLLLAKAGIDPQARADALTVRDFVTLAAAYDTRT